MYFVLFRYAFRSEEKVALQEIGPRFTLKLRSLRKDLPAVQNFGEAPKAIQIEVGTEAQEDADEAQAREHIGDEQRGPEGEGGVKTGENEGSVDKSEAKKSIKPPTQDEFLWVWKVCVLKLAVYYPLTLEPTSHSRNWRRPDGHSFCKVRDVISMQWEL